MTDTTFVHNKRIIVVEDDHSIRLLLIRALQLHGFEVSAVADAPEALRLIESSGLPTLFILDFTLPSMTGAQLAERIKRMGDTPIIFLTGNTSKQDTVDILERYAEDYITKPFYLEEVIVRINRVIKRLGDQALEGGQIRIDDHLSLEFPRSRIIRDGEPVSLTPIENGLLFILYTNRGKFVPSETLLNRIWTDGEATDDTLRVHLSRLRTKLQGDRKNTQYIIAERGSGYTFAQA